MPSMLVRMAAASRPEKMLDAMLPECQMAMRSGDSCLVYHDDVMSDTAGRNGPSVRPTRKRQSRKAQPASMAGMQTVTADHASMQQGSRMRGCPLATTTAAGIWDTM